MFYTDPYSTFPNLQIPPPSFPPSHSFSLSQIPLAKQNHISKPNLKSQISQIPLSRTRPPITNQGPTLRPKRASIRTSRSPSKTSTSSQPPRSSSSSRRLAASTDPGARTSPSTLAAATSPEFSTVQLLYCHLVKTPQSTETETLKPEAVNTQNKKPTTQSLCRIWFSSNPRFCSNGQDKDKIRIQVQLQV